MRKLIPLIAIASIIATTAAVSARETTFALTTDWVGVAAAPNKRVFETQNGSTEAGARAAAKYECEQTTGRTCSAIAVPASWDAVVLSCSAPGLPTASFIGGSGQGYARDVALQKANAAGFDAYDCTEIYWY